MLILTVIFFAGLLACGTVYYFIRNDVLFSVTITFGTCFYHFGMRLAVGHGINAIFHNKMDYNRRWFKEKKFEAKLYKIIKVKKWKKLMPTYDPKSFSATERSVEEIVQATCQSEIVHEIIMLLSFVPVIFTVWFGSLLVFLITSCLAFCFDGIFVIMQRYNRPRLMRLLKRNT